MQHREAFRGGDIKGDAPAFSSSSRDGAKAPPGAPQPPRDGIQLQALRKELGRWQIVSFQNTNSVPEMPFPKGPSHGCTHVSRSNCCGWPFEPPDDGFIPDGSHRNPAWSVSGREFAHLHTDDLIDLRLPRAIQAGLRSIRRHTARDPSG